MRLWRVSTLSRLTSDQIVLWPLYAFAGLAGMIVLLILGFLLLESAPALLSVGAARFLGDPAWRPAGPPAEAGYNLAPMLAGSLAATLGAVLLAGPLGVASAVFGRFYAPPRIALLYQRVHALLAGIPSVVYGFWGLTVLAPLIRQWQPPGQSLLAAILILALMIVPTVTLLSDAALRGVPRAWLDGAAALGLSRPAIIWNVALPAARGGILAAIMLATARAVGETMAVLMVAGNVVQHPSSLFDPMRTLTANIALELGYALDYHRAALFVSGLVLMALVMGLIFAVARLEKVSHHA